MAENRQIPENYWDILSYTMHIWASGFYRLLKRQYISFSSRMLTTQDIFVG